MKPLQLALFDVAPAPVASGHPMPRGVPLDAQRFVLLDSQRVAYTLRRARRRSIGFVVGADGLVVSAPRGVGAAAIDAALRAKSGWIVRKLRECDERERRLAALRIDWRDGARVPFLGADVVVRLDAATTGAVLHPVDDAGPATLHLGLPAAADALQIRDAVQAWLQRQARRVFAERAAHFAPRIGVVVERLALSSATTRWGSASADGSVRLNWRLVHFGPAVIDYVVAHELAHLREMHHGPAFWAVVEAALPGYRTARRTLREQLLQGMD